MARFQPSDGKGNNLLAWVDGFDDLDGTTKMRLQNQMMQEEIVDYRDDWNRLRRTNPKLADKIRSARYDWLFDDLQKFTPIGAEDIKSQEDLRFFIRETVGQSKMARGMGDAEFQRVEDKMIKGFLDSPVREVIVKNLADRVSPEEINVAISDIKVRQRRNKAFALASKEKLWRINRQDLVAEGLDKRGRTFYYNYRTGRRYTSPFKILKAAGF